MWPSTTRSDPNGSAIGEPTPPTIGELTLPTIGGLTLPAIGELTLPTIGGLVEPSPRGRGMGNGRTIGELTRPAIGGLTLPTIGGLTLPTIGELVEPSPRSRGRRLLIWPLLLAAGFCWWLWLAPAWLGGSTGYVLVTGHSMEPTLRAGDLVVVRPQGSYAVGDLVTVRPGGGAQVIHRIVGGSSASGWITQGDNNPLRDSWVVRESEIVGMEVFFLPGPARIGQFLQGHGWVAPLGAAAFVLVWMLASGQRTPKYPEEYPATRSQALEPGLDSKCQKPRRRTVSSEAEGHSHGHGS